MGVHFPDRGKKINCEDIEHLNNKSVHIYGKLVETSMGCICVSNETVIVMAIQDIVGWKNVY